MDLNGGPPVVEFRVDVDSEGVCRVLDCSAKVIHMTPVELGKLLTAVVKALGGDDDDDQNINVRFN